jgi:hypothetical protein
MAPASRALAQDPATVEAAKDPAGSVKKFPDPAQPWRSALGVNLHAAAGFEKPAMAFGAGLRWRFAKPWVVGLDGEWNPFISVSGTAVRSGTFNGYFTLIHRWPLVFEPINLRSTLNLGTSVLLMDLYGARRGSVGIFAGASFLGIEWKVARAAYLIIDPIAIALPAPHLSGVPFAYLQFRSTLGLEIDLF